jgi:hypothetical protein
LARVPPRRRGNGHVRGNASRQPPVTLAPDPSATLREKLLAQLGAITSADSAAAWARKALAAKNSLAAIDAKLVEDAFERRLAEFVPSEITDATESAEAAAGRDGHVVAADQGTLVGATNDFDQLNGIDKSVLRVAAPRRYRNRDHLRYVAQQACLICGRKQSDPHHLRFMQPRALGRKVSDEFAVPLCRFHHRAVHRAGDEQAWWKAAGIDAAKVARKLWRQTRLHDPQDRPEAGAAVRPRTGPTGSTSDAVAETGSSPVVMTPVGGGRAP